MEPGEAIEEGVEQKEFMFGLRRFTIFKMSDALIGENLDDTGMCLD